MHAWENHERPVILSSFSTLFIYVTSECCWICCIPSSIFTAVNWVHPFFFTQKPRGEFPMHIARQSFLLDFIEFFIQNDNLNIQHFLNGLVNSGYYRCFTSPFQVSDQKKQYNQSRRCCTVRFHCKAQGA